MTKKKKESSKKEGKGIKDKKTSKKGKKNSELKQEKKKKSKKDKPKAKKKEKLTTKKVKIEKEKSKKKEAKLKPLEKQSTNIQVEAPKAVVTNEAKKSTDFNAKTAISKVRALKTVASIEKFVEGDVRITVMKVAASKINQFKK